MVPPPAGRQPGGKPYAQCRGSRHGGDAVSQATVAPGGTVAGRPQPQTTAEPAGGPFVRHAPDGRRAQYVATTGASGFISNPTVSCPGYVKGYKLQTSLTLVGGASTPVPVADFPD